MEPEGGRLLQQRNLGYFKRVQRFGPAKKIQEEFENCLLFRIWLFDLREQLFTYIRNTFIPVERQLRGKSILSMKDTIKKNVRTTDPTGKSLDDIAKLRTEKIDKLKETQFTDTQNWSTIAGYYTGSFLEWKDNQTKDKQSKDNQRNYNQRKGTQKKDQTLFSVNNEDPKALLEILKNCSLFSNNLYAAAFVVIGHRNKFYGHLSVLLIESDDLKKLATGIQTLIQLIPA